MYLFNLRASALMRHAVMSLPLALWLPCTMAQTPAAPQQAHAPTPASTAPAILARGASGTSVSITDVLSELQRAPEPERQALLSKPDKVLQIVNNLLLRRVLAAQAEREGLGSDPIMAATLAIARERVLSDARLAQIDAQNNVSEAALDAYARNVYQVNTARFQRPAQTRASHILLGKGAPDSLQKAQALLAQLRAGASFAELARANSTDTGSAARGGDLGFFAAGKMVKPFEDAVNALAKPGDLSEPVESEFGYHIIRLDERRDKGRQPYEEVRAQLLTEARAAILNESRKQLAQSLEKDFVFEREAIEALGTPAAR